MVGLATLTNTLSLIAFLNPVLERPSNELPFCLFPVGYPAADCVVPDLKRRGLDKVLVILDQPTEQRKDQSYSMNTTLG